VDTVASPIQRGVPKQKRALPETLPFARVLVRDLLTASPSYHSLAPAQRRSLAESMVRVCHAGISLLREELESRERAHNVAATSPQLTPKTTAPEQPARGPVLAAAQSAGSDFSGVSAQKVAGTTQAILNAVSFPRFVTDLINGVFKAIVTSNTQQMNAYVELLNNVSTSLSGFAETNFSDDGARQWLVEKFPGSFETAGNDSSDTGDRQIQLRDGAKMPSEDALKTVFGLGASDSIPSGDPERTLLPFARIQMARQRQQMLATMVMLGMQRIVIESGKINASMRFHIDTRSAAQADQGSTFNFQNTVNAAGSFGVGPWGVSASVSNTIGYVSTQRSQTTEEMNTDLDLNSSVEINFKSDYLPLNRLASNEQASKIRANTLNPEAEAQAAEKDRAARNADLDKTRWQSLDKTLQPQSAPAPPAAGAPGTVQDAQKARERGNADAAKKKSAGSSSPPSQKPVTASSPPSTAKAAGS
jgi:hypothetical protein